MLLRQTASLEDIMSSPASHPVNILFTSVGRRVELLRSFRKAYQQSGIQGAILATDIDPLAPALGLADRPYLVPRLDQQDFIPTLVEICRHERVTAVFPLIDPDIPVLAAHKEELEATGARLAVIPNGSVPIANDKWLTYVYLMRLGLPVPQTWLPDQIDPGQVEYPLFIKPRKGSAAKSTFRLNSERELAFFKDYVPEAVIQEYLPGPEITTDVVCDLEGGLLGMISRKRIEVRSGEVAKGVTIFDLSIAEACTRIASELPAVGPITVQCMLKEGKPYFTEINARMGGGIPLAIAAGADVPGWLLARIAGLPLDLPKPGSYRCGLYLTRFDESYFLTGADLDRLAGNHF
jgi:carbamoyl-phosphate synthase large subunit